MKRQIFDEEIRLECDCGDPFEFVHFGLQREDANWPEPMFFISHITYFGRFWRRLKKALLFLWKGQWEEESDLMLLGYDHIERLCEFCERCLRGKK